MASPFISHTSLLALLDNPRDLLLEHTTNEPSHTGVCDTLISEWNEDVGLGSCTAGDTITTAGRVDHILAWDALAGVATLQAATLLSAALSRPQSGTGNGVGGVYFGDLLSDHPLITATLAVNECAFDPSSYDGVVDLDASVGYKLHHSVNEGTGVWRVALQVTDSAAASAGWVGFGLAETTGGHMKGSDVVTVSVSAATGLVTAVDRYVPWAPSVYGGVPQGLYPVEDATNDWRIVGGSISGLHGMVVELERAIDTGDSQDRVLSPGSVPIVWARGSGDGKAVNYHGAQRGSTRIRFFDDAATAAQATELPPHAGSWKLQFSDYAVPASDTVYACQSFVLPTDMRRHVIAVNWILSSEAALAPVVEHHGLLHVCSDNAYHAALRDNPMRCEDGAANAAKSPLGDVAVAGCTTLMATWTPGDAMVVLPDDVGLPVGSDSLDASYVVMEMHFDNPSGAAVSGWCVCGKEGELCREVESCGARRHAWSGEERERERDRDRDRERWSSEAKGVRERAWTTHYMRQH